ncbi:DUF805 domain-containing protein [Phenylobacterium sp.]|uniref:DUF805 domain-containing protein n=1 Tax=Phenylobacterium sp. TaxID=1871053 RepID=UPI00273733E1|nr:DUF805 domain-containing protein [Phenylobacterium sp.]MDP3853352.1 DUF805 domain-containing protein [Phenylobacterium sp.]
MVAVLFSLAGRIGRLTFWIGAIGLFLGLLAYQYLTGGLVLILIGYAIWAYPQAALLVKRLHDVNRSGWWALAPAAALVLGGVIFGLGDTAGTASPLRMISFSVPMACGIGFALGFLAWVGSKAGSVRENRFGPPPEPFDGD